MSAGNGVVVLRFNADIKLSALTAEWLIRKSQKDGKGFDELVNDLIEQAVLAAAWEGQR